MDGQVLDGAETLTIAGSLTRDEEFSLQENFWQGVGDYFLGCGNAGT